MPDALVLPEDEDANPYERELVRALRGASRERTPRAQVTAGVDPDAEGGLVPIDRNYGHGEGQGPTPGSWLATSQKRSRKKWGRATSSGRWHWGATTEARKTVLSLEGKPLDGQQGPAGKAQSLHAVPAIILREGRDPRVPCTGASEACSLDGHSIKRKEDNLSLPLRHRLLRQLLPEEPPAGPAAPPPPSSMVDIPPRSTWPASPRSPSPRAPLAPGGE